MWEALVPIGPGPANAITDVCGLEVGHYHRIGDGWATGTTVVLARDGAVGGVNIGGGAPGTRETAVRAMISWPANRTTSCITSVQITAFIPPRVV